MRTPSEHHRQPTSAESPGAELRGVRVGVADVQADVPSSEVSVATSPGRLQNIISVAAIDQALVSLASFAMTIIVGRACGSAELGIYAISVKIFWLVAGIPNALIWIPYTARAARLPLKRREYYLGSATAQIALFSLLTTMALLLVAIASASGLTGRPWLVPLCLALIPFAALMLLKEHLRRVMIAHLDTAKLLGLDIPIAVVTLVALAILWRLQVLNATNALLCVAAGCSWALVWAVLRRNTLFRFSKNRFSKHVSYDFRLGKWLFATAIFWLVAEAFCHGYVESLHGLEVLGRYSAALTIVMFFNPLTLTAQNVVRSFISKHAADSAENRLWNITVNSTTLFAGAFGGLFLLLALGGGPLVQLCFSDEYTDLGWVVASLCLGAYCHVISIPAEASLSVLHDGKSIATAAAVRMTLIVLAGPVLIGNFGPQGVGLALALGSTGGLLILVATLRNRCLGGA